MIGISRPLHNVSSAFKTSPPSRTDIWATGNQARDHDLGEAMNHVRLTRRNTKAAVLFALALAPLGANADTVTAWNQNADTATPLFPALKFRILSMVQGAVHDALNSIESRYESYLPVAPAAPGASPDAAVGGAAYRVLSQR